MCDTLQERVFSISSGCKITRSERSETNRPIQINNIMCVRVLVFLRHLYSIYMILFVLLVVTRKIAHVSQQAGSTD